MAINKHYLLGTYKYVVKQKDGLGDQEAERLLEEEYKNRLRSSSTVTLNFVIHPFSKIQALRLTSQSYPLFYVLLPEHLSMIQAMMNHSREIDVSRKNLPEVALERILISNLITEIQSSNDIEGVQSTRKELEEAVSAIESKKKVRFKSTVRQYLATLKQDKLILEHAEEIRELYDGLLQGEIEKDNLPDGRKFRKGPVQILDLSKGQAIHSGDSSEAEIEADMQKLICFQPWFVSMRIMARA